MAAAVGVKACMKLALSPESTKQVQSAASSVVLWFDQSDPSNITAEQCEFCGQGCRTGEKKKKIRGSTKLHYFF